MVGVTVCDGVGGEIIVGLTVGDEYDNAVVLDGGFNVGEGDEFDVEFEGVVRGEGSGLSDRHAVTKVKEIITRRTARGIVFILPALFFPSLAHYYAAFETLLYPVTRTIFGTSKVSNVTIRFILIISENTY